MATNARPKPSAAAKALRGYDSDQLLCRFGNLGHVWDIVGYFRSGIAGEVRRTLACARCGTERQDRWLSGSGERLASSYRYAEGYRLDLEGEHMAASDVRLEAIRRADVYANEAQMLAAMTGSK